VDGKRSDNEKALGGALRRAREERGLSVDEAAQALRLSARIVSALEECAFERLPGPTYVRGYLRNYAQFLGLSAQPLVDAYNRMPQAAQKTDMAAPAPVRQVTSSDLLVRLGTGLVLLVVFGLAALWWVSHESGETPSTVATSIPTPTPATIAPVSPPPPKETATEEQSAGVTQPAAPTPAPVPAIEKTEESTPTPAPAPAVANAAPAPPPLPPDAPVSHLVLFVNQDSWADVRDAQQRRLLYETIPAGRVVSVDGVAPLSVFLGNVEGVIVEFNGEPYDALRHKRGQVARFTLGSPRN